MQRPRTRSELLEALREASTELFERYYGDALSLKLVLNMTRGNGGLSHQVNLTEYLRTTPSRTLPDEPARS